MQRAGDARTEPHTGAVEEGVKHTCVLTLRELDLIGLEKGQACLGV